jgi:hypothetical protein
MTKMENDRNAPATKGDLADLETRIRGDIRGDMADMETRIVDRLTETMRDVQTELLKSFYGFMETVQSRFKAQDDAEAGLKKRMSVLEERLLEVEKRINMPPAA